jgi:hypothetical protein
MQTLINYCRNCKDVVSATEEGKKLLCTKCGRVLRDLSESPEGAEVSRPTGFGTVAHKTKPHGRGW